MAQPSFNLCFNEKGVTSCHNIIIHACRGSLLFAALHMYTGVRGHTLSARVATCCVEWGCYCACVPSTASYSCEVCDLREQQKSRNASGVRICQLGGLAHLYVCSRRWASAPSSVVGGSGRQVLEPAGRSSRYKQVAFDGCREACNVQNRAGFIGQGLPKLGYVYTVRCDAPCTCVPCSSCSWMLLHFRPDRGSTSALGHVHGASLIVPMLCQAAAHLRRPGPLLMQPPCVLGACVCCCAFAWAPTACQLFKAAAFAALEPSACVSCVNSVLLRTIATWSWSALLCSVCGVWTCWMAPIC